MENIVKEKPKILIVADRYLPKVDGVLTFIQEFIKESKQDFDISFLAPRYSNKKIVGAKTILLDLSNKWEVFTYKLSKISWKNIKKIKKAVKDSDLVFLQEYGPASIIALFFARRLQKKTALYLHNTPWQFASAYFNLKENIFKLLTKFYIYWMKKIDLLIAPYSQYLTELSNKQIINGKENNLQVAKLGVDINRFYPSENKALDKEKLNLPKDKQIITFVGRISPEKNTLLLLDAFKKLQSNQRNDLFLLIVGDGKKEIVDQFKNQKNCLCTGFVTNVEDYLRASDLFVMPSKTETTSLATLEAMATGLPVLATKVGYINQYLRKSYNGEFISRQNSHLLMKKIIKILDNQTYYNTLSKNARKVATHSFSWGKSINKIKNLLENLLKNN